MDRYVLILLLALVVALAVWYNGPKPACHAILVGEECVYCLVRSDGGNGIAETLSVTNAKKQSTHSMSSDGAPTRAKSGT